MYNQNQSAFGSLDFGTVHYGDEQWEETDTGSEPVPHHHMVWSDTPVVSGDAFHHPNRTEEPDVPSPLRVSGSDTQSGVTSYSRNNKTLPFVKGGATDAGVEKSTGIKGLVSKIKQKMITQGVSSVSSTGALTDAEIKAYQQKKGLTADGIIGAKTYKALGFPAPYPKSRSRGSSSYNPSTDVAIGAEPFYKKKWFLYTITGVALAGTAYLLFAPKK